MFRGLLLLVLGIAASACTSGMSDPAGVAAAATRPLTITIVGTNDLHGAILARRGRGGLALFSSCVAALRAARARDGAVLLVDAGDLFQGTLPSNLTEGRVVIDAYNAIGYDAAAIGNHDFDYGPAGERVTPRGPGDDPFGALKARASEADFPFLAANILDAATGRPIAWRNVKPSVLMDKAGVRIGIIGVSTEATLRSTMAANVQTLAMAPIARTVAAEAAALRRTGAQIVVAVAHAGGRCADLGDPSDVSSCDPSMEIMQAAAALPRGAVDLIVAGHTHLGMAQIVNGTPIVEAFSGGRAFSRVDLTIEDGRLTHATVHPPFDIRAGAILEGTAIAPDPRVAALLAPAVERAEAAERRPLGVVLDDPIRREIEAESPEGNLFADLMLAARPLARVAITNGGGLRADLPRGPLTYGQLYEAMPFDNRFAMVRMTGAELARLFEENLQREDGILSIAGVAVEARCDAAKVKVRLPFGPSDRVLVATSDFLATGAAFAKIPRERITIEDGPTIRDAMASVLAERGGRLRSAHLYDPERPRIRYPGPRPMRCR